VLTMKKPALILDPNRFLNLTAADLSQAQYVTVGSSIS
jgi:hypothetical protein